MFINKNSNSYASNFGYSEHVDVANRRSLFTGITVGTHLRNHNVTDDN